MSSNRKSVYSVEVIGFNQTERIVLSSIFGLSARREPKFLQHSSVAFTPDLYLVDASDEQAVQLLKARNASGAVPAILIGDSNHGTNFPVLARPLQWTKLFRAFDLAVASQAAPPASVAPASSAFDKTLELPARTDGLPAISPLSSVAQTSDAPVGRPPAVTPADAGHATSMMRPVPAATPTAAPPATRTPLPVAKVPGAPAAPQQGRPTPVATTPVAPVVPVAPVKNNSADWVLVVDDNLTVREFMKAKLAPFNFNVDYAESGEQAVGFTGQKHYTCVFLDVIMPGIDGYQVCKLIKSKKSAAKTAVVMLTSKGSPFDKIRGAMAGCDAYLTKPVDEDKLLETIVRFLPVTH